MLGNIDRIKEIVQDIKKHSCDHDKLINLATEEDGYNMLHFAVHYKKLEIVKFLTENGAGESNTYDQVIKSYMNTSKFQPLYVMVNF